MRVFYNHFYNILRHFDISPFFFFFFSPQVKRYAIITYKHGIYLLSREVPNDLRSLTILAILRPLTKDNCTPLPTPPLPQSPRRGRHPALKTIQACFRTLFTPDPLMPHPIPPSPQVKRCAIITHKHGIYDLAHESPNDLRP